MSNIKYKERILDAIDQLRRRKARPDIHRICNFLMRRHSISSNDVKADLQRCVDCDIVLKVEYKGSISYRNAAKKFSHLKQRTAAEENTPAPAAGSPIATYGGKQPYRKFVELLTDAFGQLIIRQPDFLEIGIPPQVLIQNILSKDNVRYTKKYVSILLEKEVDLGSLIKMSNGNFLLGRTKSEQTFEVGNRSFRGVDGFGVEKDRDREGFFGQKQPTKKAVKLTLKRGKMEIVSAVQGDFKSGDNGIVRVGRRRKRAKKVFDPSDNNVPKKRGRPIGSLNKSTIEKQLAKLSEIESRPESRSPFCARQQGGVCCVCHNINKLPNDQLVCCRECSNKAHMNCLSGEDMMLKMYPDNTWQCPHCKTCRICFETSDAGYLVVCSVCTDAYHVDCHKPRIEEEMRNGTKWLCLNCQMPEQLQVTEIHPNMSSSNVFTQRLIDEDKNYPSSSLYLEEDSRHNSPLLSTSSLILSPQGLSRSGAPTPEMKHSPPELQELDIDQLIDPLIPDATHWTTDDVYNYFYQYFPEEAKVFKEQEIDGRSLLLMKRLDVLQSLKLELGTALKIYRHVVKLQFRRDDPKLYWL